MTMPTPTMNDDSLKNGLMTSAVLHVLALLFLYFGLPHLMPPLPEHHDPVPFQIVEIADLTNTRVKEEIKPEEPKPEPPKPLPKPEQAVTPPPPTPPPPPAEKPPEEKVEALKAAPVPKPKPPEVKPVTEDFNKLLKNLEVKKPATPPTPAEKADSKAPATPVASHAPSLSDRLTTTEEDALRRQIGNCWNPDLGARNAQDLVIELLIAVNPDRTVISTEVVDKSRYASDGFFRAAADRAVRAVQNPKCSPLELPPDKYDLWKTIHFFFDPKDLL